MTTDYQTLQELRRKQTAENQRLKRECRQKDEEISRLRRRTGHIDVERDAQHKNNDLEQLKIKAQADEIEKLKSDKGCEACREKQLQLEKKPDKAGCALTQEKARSAADIAKNRQCRTDTSEDTVKTANKKIQQLQRQLQKAFEKAAKEAERAHEWRSRDTAPGPGQILRPVRYGFCVFRTEYRKAPSGKDGADKVEKTQ